VHRADLDVKRIGHAPVEILELVEADSLHAVGGVLEGASEAAVDLRELVAGLL
jgi:hypothetical protein